MSFLVTFFASMGHFLPMERFVCNWGTDIGREGRKNSIISLSVQKREERKIEEGEGISRPGLLQSFRPLPIHRAPIKQLGRYGIRQSWSKLLPYVQMPSKKGAKQSVTPIEHRRLAGCCLFLRLNGGGSRKRHTRWRRRSFTGEGRILVPLLSYCVSRFSQLDEDLTSRNLGKTHEKNSSNWQG